MSNTLHLTVTKEWFLKILQNEKKEDFREIKPYWTKRLLYEDLKTPRKFDFIKIKNGYKKDAPMMLCLFGGIRVTRANEKTDLGKGKYYAIKIDRVIGSNSTAQTLHL